MFGLFTGYYEILGLNLVGSSYVVAGYMVLVFGAIILGRENFSWIGLAYFFCSVPIAVWLLFLSCVILVPRASAAYTLSFVLPLGFLTPIPLFYHALTVGLKKYDRRRPVVAVCWILGITFTLLGVSTNFIVKGLRRFSWGYYPEYSNSAYIVTAYMTVVLCLIMIELWLEFRQSPGNSRQRTILKHLLVAVALTGLMILDALPAYGVNVPPFGFLFAIAAMGYFAYIITNYSLDPISPEFAADEILSTMRDGLLVTDREGSIRMANDAVTDVLGYAKSDLEGRSLEWLTAGEIRQQELTGYETEIESPRGEGIPVSFSSSRLEDWGGNLHGWVVVLRDISDRKQAERKLQESEERFRQMAENIDDVFWLYDREREEFLYWSPGFEEMYGDSRSDAPESVDDWQKMIKRKGADGSVGSIEPYLKSNREFTINYRIEVDNESRWIEESGVPVRNEEGEIYRVAGVARDVTEVRKKNALIRRKNRELEQFAYAASHDLQKPLRQLMTFCEFVEEDLREDDEEALRRDIEEIEETARTMEELIQALLQLSRAGRDALEIEQVDLNDCVDEVLGLFSTETEEQSATVQSEESLPTVLADRALLQQVLQNLIGNALKYNEGDPRVEIFTESGEDETIIGVRDNGIGIDPDQARRIFQPFERLHGDDEYGGTGVGLGICSKIVERHGGRIWLDTDWEEGTCIKFSLPDQPGSISEGRLDSPVQEFEEQ